jgi:DNA-binding MarR family transcriptional regulator/GNAT superfamily N-acetyltransferase
VRSFNRFVTRRFGVLERGFLGSNHSLTEARLLYELAQAPQLETVDLRAALGIDSGYLSRLLARLGAQGLVWQRRSERDGRRRVLGLTDAGRAAYAVLDGRASVQASELLDALPEPDRRRLLSALDTVQRLLARPALSPALELRAPEPGELGWIVERHGALYAAEHGWNERFEALVARVVADFAATRDRARNAAWIAALDGRPSGSVVCVDAGEGVAKLRLLLVEPSARGLGLGRRLVERCVTFARAAGYAELTLWTNDVLTSARRIYEAVGFRLEAEEAHTLFGPRVVGQDWRLTL